MLPEVLNSEYREELKGNSTDWNMIVCLLSNASDILIPSCEITWVRIQIQVWQNGNVDFKGNEFTRPQKPFAFLANRNGKSSQVRKSFQMITASLTTLWSAVSFHNAASKNLTSRAKFHNIMGFYLRDNEIIMSIVNIHTDHLKF